MRIGVVLFVVVAVVSACGATGPAVRHTSPSASSQSPATSPTPSQSPTSNPSTSPTAPPTPVVVPAWAALTATCSGAPTASEALLTMQGSSTPVLADVADPNNPHPICTLSGGSFQPQLVTQTMISWYATQGSVGTPGTSLIAGLDLFTGTSTIAASWNGGGFMDGLHAWSPDRGFLAYVTSDSGAVTLHLLSGGGDRVVATMGAVPGRGVNPNDDDAFLGFSPDGAYFALVQTFTGSGDQLQVRHTLDGSLAFNLPKATMATWGSAGSRLYYRLPGSTQVQVWDSTAGVSQAFGQPLSWIRPRAAVATDDTLAFTARDSSGMPHTWVYSHSGRSGGELPNPRSSAVWLSSTAFFYVEEAACGSSCGIGPAWQPDGKTFVFDTAKQAETASHITAVFGAWPRPGQA